MRLNFALLSSLVMLGSACPAKLPAPPPVYTGDIDPDEGADAGYAQSAKGNLIFKGPEKLEADLAAALGLPTDGVCNELGQYSCTKTVHVVSLGGVDPYTHSVYERASVTGSSTPVVIDRVVLAACTARVNADLATPATAVIFKNLAPVDGKLLNIDGDEVKNAIGELSQRAWLRDPGESDIAVMVQMARDIEAKGGAAPGKEWMQAACFVAFSSVESIFY